ncbi:tetratricopeptide repeat protein [Parasphingorhabdus sp. JC815]|uniref:tetratricopeptide repeat protein n=1 Tax=Parasphingorhabdus sp. JC815 TaxID=3232140 RepID=UPI003458C326
MRTLFSNISIPYAKALVLVIVAGLLFASLPSAIRAANSGSADARIAYAKAQDYHSRGDIRSARIEMLNAIKADPQWIDARVLQAQILLEFLDGVGAEAELERAFDLGLDISKVRHLYGHALQLQGKWDEAKNQLLADDIPFEHQAYAARIIGRVALQTGDEAMASRAFDQAIQKDPGNATIWVDVARFRGDSGDQAGAIAAIEKAVELEPGNIRALQYRGELLRFQFGLAAALPWFERALQIAPNDVPLLTEYAATLGDIGRMTDMLTVARKIIALDGSNPRAFFMQAVLAARAGKFDLARRLMQKTEGRLADVPAVLLVQGVIAYEETNYNVALDNLRRLASLQPNNLQARNLLARLLYLVNEPDEAINLLKPQADHGGAAPYALWLSGRSLESMDMRPQSIDFLQRASLHEIGEKTAFVPETPFEFLRVQAIRDQSNAATVIPYIRALYQSGDFSGALTQARYLQEDNPGATDAHILVADAAMAQGNLDDALAALEQAKNIYFSEPVMLRIVDLLRARGEQQRAGEVLAEYLAYNPTSLSGLRWMAYGYLEAENWDMAQRIFENIRQRIGNNDALIMAGLAHAYTETQQIEKAVKAAQIAYHVQPSSPVVTHIYGRALLEQGTRPKDAYDLLKKAAVMTPQNAIYQASFTRASEVLNQ